MMATVAPAPVETSQAAGKPLRAAHHSTGVLGAVPIAVSGVVRAGSLGSKRGRPRCSTSTRATRGSARRRTARARRPVPLRGRRVTRWICGTLKPAGRAPAVAASAAALTRARGRRTRCDGDEQASGLRRLRVRGGREDEPERGQAQ